MAEPARPFDIPPKIQRRCPIGAEVQPDGTVHVRVWAPMRRCVEIILGDKSSLLLDSEPDGYYSGLISAVPGDRYRFLLDGEGPYPDPASRSQPEGPHGPSEIIDPQFAWTDARWRGPTATVQVLYEMHVGTFTPEGTWLAASDKLGHLKDLGVTVIEVMPVAEYPGRFGWGYDGVNLFAPMHLYGRPDDFRRFVDHAHAAGLGVILDVVYNHLGPNGNYLNCYSKDYVTDRYANEWGEALNFDGPNSRSVREFFVSNAAFWIDEYHLDGLRLDATQQMFDTSHQHIVAEITQAVRTAAPSRRTLVIGENEPQHAILARPVEQGGYGLDALWNDDLHHSATVAATGHNEAYYSDHRGSPQEFIAAAKYGYLYQGQWYVWQGKTRGMPTIGLGPSCFVNFLQNHDQVANSGRGIRLHKLAAPGRLRALTALTILMPGMPMLFQGQEFAASAPFLYFADHEPELADKVAAGRAEFLAQFPSIADPKVRDSLAPPDDELTFSRCKLNWSERRRHTAALALHKDLLRLRSNDPVLADERPQIDGAVLANEAFCLRWFAEGNDRLLIVNLGLDHSLLPGPDPLLAPPNGMIWRRIWSSEDPKYDGLGTPAQVEPAGGKWIARGHAAVLLKAEPAA